jgi:two-component system OmpR family response regulator
VLDRRLPRLDGLAMLKRLREQDRDTRVLILSATTATADRLDGFAAGADAYLGKPYVFAELLARLEVLGRQAEAWRDRQKLVVADLELDLQARTARRAGQAVGLQRREFLILAFLMRHAGQVVTRSMLLEAVWDYDFEPRGNVVDMHVHRLRQKLEPDGSPPLIHTVVGSGYMIRDPVTDDAQVSVAS